MSTERDTLESDLRGQTRVLRRLAQGAALGEVLAELVAVAEESRPEMLASVLLLDEVTGRLHHGASGRLPKFFCDAVDGVKAGPKVGSCGTAAFLAKRVIVEDIQTDELWVRERELASRASLRACWSEPIMSSTSEVLGTFAMYYREPRAPSEADLGFVYNNASLAALAIERVRYQNQIERERAVLTTIVNDVPDALVLGDLDRKITHFSRGASRIFGYDPSEVIGQSTTFLYDDPADYERLARERFSTGLTESLEATEVQWRRKSGETFPGEIVGTVVRDENGKPLGFLGLIRDISERKIAEARLAESQDRLVQAERLAAMGQMVSAIAHESRNALQRIQVSVDVLQYEFDANSEAREDLDRIRRAKDDLQRLHDELRNFAGPIRLSVDRSSLAICWRQAWNNLKVLRGSREAELVESEETADLQFHFDSFRMEQVFRNLFENALAACEDPVRITVTCEKRSSRGLDAIVVNVSDNGPGIPAEDCDQIFDAFYTTKPKGNGLGMAIAKRFVEAHRGTIRLRQDQQDSSESEDGKRSSGANFEIVLPLAAVDPDSNK